MTHIKNGVLEIGKFCASNGWFQGEGGEMMFESRTNDGAVIRIPATNAIFMISLAQEQMGGKKSPSVKQLIAWLTPPKPKAKVPHLELEGRARVEMVMRFLFHNSHSIMTDVLGDDYDTNEAHHPIMIEFDATFPKKLTLIIDAFIPSMYSDEKVHTAEENFEFFNDHVDLLKMINRLYREAEKKLNEGYC